MAACKTLSFGWDVLPRVAGRGKSSAGVAAGQSAHPVDEDGPEACEGLPRTAIRTTCRRWRMDGTRGLLVVANVRLRGRLGMVRRRTGVVGTGDAHRVVVDDREAQRELVG